MHQTNCKISLDLFDDEKAEEDPEKVSQNLKVSFFDFQQGKAQVYKTNPWKCFLEAEPTKLFFFGNA